MTFQQFIHVNSTVNICYLPSACLRLSINLPIKTAAWHICLYFSQSPDLSITRVLYLSPAWSPPNSLSTVAQLSLYVTQKFFYVLWFMHAHTQTHTQHIESCCLDYFMLFQAMHSSSAKMMNINRRINRHMHKMTFCRLQSNLFCCWLFNMLTAEGEYCSRGTAVSAR